MKKLLFAFFILDLVFVGLILKIAPSSDRNIASIEDSNLPANLTDGQKNKWLLVKSFQFDIAANQLVLKTDLLQSLCDVTSIIELVYLAENVAYSGAHPSVNHAFSCLEIKKDMSKNMLMTPFAAIVKARKESTFDINPGEQIRAFKLFDDEPLPKQWTLSEIKVLGQSKFSINSAEIQQALGHEIKFTISEE